jgi:hypothetical protein
LKPFKGSRSNFLVPCREFLNPGAAFFLATVFLLSGCAKQYRDDSFVTGDYTPSRQDEIRKMIGTVTGINASSPSTFSAAFNVTGLVKNKRFKSIGKAEYSRNPRRMDISFMDFIFRSTVTRMLQNGDVVRVYFPVEKKMFVDNINTMDLANYSGIDMDFHIIYDLAIGSIPLIKNYRVKRGLSANGENRSMLILENREYYETISFNGDMPDKLLLVNRRNGERLEIHLRKYLKSGKSHFFKKIRFIAERSGLRLDIEFNKIRLNVPVKVNTVETIKLPSRLEVIQM